MNARPAWILFTVSAISAAMAYALNPPSSSTGPVRLLNCLVSPQGVLEAAVDNQTADSMTCAIRCNYELGDRVFTHTFTETVPAHFQGRLGRFDTGSGKAGSYTGDVLACRKLSR